MAGGSAGGAGGSREDVDWSGATNEGSREVTTKIAPWASLPLPGTLQNGQTTRNRSHVLVRQSLFIFILIIYIFILPFFFFNTKGYRSMMSFDSSFLFFFGPHEGGLRSPSCPDLPRTTSLFPPFGPKAENFRVRKKFGIEAGPLGRGFY